MTQAYDKGDAVRLAVQFKTIDEVNTDPTVITLTVKKPGLGTLTFTSASSPSMIIRTGAGAYYLDLALDVAGVWRFKWFGSGALTAAEEGQIFVRASSV